MIVMLFHHSEARRTESTGSLPEWMTEGPSSQLETIELKGFNDEIEQERKGNVILKPPRRVFIDEAYGR